MHAIAPAAAFALWLAACANAQELQWSQAPETPRPTPATLLLEHEQLRDYEPTGRLVETLVHGPLSLEVREVIAATKDGKPVIAEPASITVRYRNRLEAAATGYRLGGDFTYNGVLIESWNGSSACIFNRWRLEFAGERLRLTEHLTLAQEGCTAN